MISSRTAAKWLGGVAATLMLTLTVTAAPANAKTTHDGGTATTSARDTGWD